MNVGIIALLIGLVVLGLIIWGAKKESKEINKKGGKKCQS